MKLTMTGVSAPYDGCLGMPAKKAFGLEVANRHLVARIDINSHKPLLCFLTKPALRLNQRFGP